MSTRRISELDPYITSDKKSTIKSNESPELDVFEAAGYFSGYNEIFTEKSWRQGGGRISLDIMPSMKNHHQQQQPSYSSSMLDQKKQAMINNSSSNIKEKKYKQPSSPGGRLASFLNSLFSQSSSKKKKSKSTSSTTQSMRDHHELDHESPGGRRKRRSSISHFRTSISTTSDSKSSTLYSSSSSGFRTPPPYNYHQSLQTPTKNYKELFPLSFSKYTSSGSSGGNAISGQVRHLAQVPSHDHILDDDQKKSNKVKEFKFGKGYSDKSPSGKKEYSRKKFNEIDDDQIQYDDGGESDSSSDLFELQICDLDYYSSGLPVYETTHMDSIKRGAPIPINGPL